MILWSFEGPNGDRVDLTGGPSGVDETGVVGGWMPEYDVLTRQVPNGSGEITEALRGKPRQVTVPIVVQSLTRSPRDLDDRLRELADALAPEDGAGLLVATAIDDAGGVLLDPEGFPRSRVLDAAYVGGFELDRTWGDSYGGWWQVGGLVFRADQPYYRPVFPVTRTYRSARPQTWFPLPPLVLGASSLIGGSEELNDGAVPSFPVWTVSSPGTSFTAQNVTTGQSFTVNTRTAGGQAVTVDTRPTYLGGGRTVTLADGTNLYPQLSGELWALVRGRNVLQLTVADEIAGQTSVAMTYSPQYRTP